MKAPALALLLLFVPSLAGADTYRSGFNPRFSASSDYPDQPDYRPPDRPRNEYQFYIDASPEGGDDGDDAGGGDHWPDRPHHFPPRPRHRDRHR